MTSVLPPPGRTLTRGRAEVAFIAGGAALLVLAALPVHRHSVSGDLPLDVVGGAGPGITVGGCVRLLMGRPR